MINLIKLFLIIPIFLIPMPVNLLSTVNSSAQTILLKEDIMDGPKKCVDNTDYKKNAYFVPDTPYVLCDGAFCVTALCCEITRYPKKLD